jgi:ligand-binding sensor domain-containing protein
VKQSLVIFLLLLCSAIYAQQPAYFTLGENQLKGVQIYDVIQDNNKDYWIASNEGLFRYNFSTFEKVDCDEARSNSVFNFVIDKEGVIYCHNMNNQVFRIEKRKFTLFYEIKEDEIGTDISLAIADDGNLIISSKQIMILDKKAKVLHRASFPKNYIGPAFKREDGVVQYHLNNSDSLVSYTRGKFRISRLSHVAGVLRFMNNNGQIYCIDLPSKDIYTFSNDLKSLQPLQRNSLLERSPSLRIYETKHGLWMAGTLPGVIQFKNSIQNSKAPLFYDTYFISDVYEDAEGNILLSTFDKGILVITDLQVNDVIGNFKDDPVTCFWTDPKKELLIGTSKGELLKLSGTNFSKLNQKGSRPIEVIVGNEKTIIYDDGFIRAYDKKEGKTLDLIEASLKAAVYVGNDLYFLGTNLGVYRVQFKSQGKPEIKLVRDLRFRIHRMAYDPKNSIVYLSTAKGTYSYSLDGKLTGLNFKGQELYPLNLICKDGKLYLVHRNRGILIFTNGKFEEEILPEVNGKSIHLKKQCFYKNSIIASTLDGLYQFDMQGKMLRSLHAYAGISANRVIDFTIINDQLWISHSGGIQKIDLRKMYKSPAKISLRFEDIKVNGNGNWDKVNHILNADQRMIQFVFVSPSLKNRNGIRYHFRLLGAEGNWSINNVEENQVTYRALSPGNYEFQVKAEIQGKFSPVLTFRFQVKAPFYSTWWFFSLVGAVFILLVYFIYRRQMKIQEKRSKLINELHASKLTAIQSQMNPHFIFNSLNSIQDLILKGDVEHSYSYITTFSDLVRRTLNYSEKDFIDFEQEIKLLELYLSLEKLRFKKDFNYSISSEGIEDLLLPPLLIQPFVENALVHGLLHKKGEKDLKISFHYNEHLTCVIEDNGIGRIAAKQIRQRQRAEHESFSSEAIRKRFEILSDVFQGEFGFVYEDLMQNGEAIGTRVTLRIPVRPKF